MIVPMKHLTVLTRTSEREHAITRLRELGVLHIADTAPDTPRVRETLAQVQAAEQAMALVTAAAKRIKAAAAGATSPTPDAQRSHETDRPGTEAVATEPAAILALAREQEAAEAELQTLDREYDRFSPFGDFDPAAAAALTAVGVPVTLFKAPSSTVLAAEGSVLRTILSESSDTRFGVQIGEAELPAGADPVELPARRLAATVAARDDARARIVRAERHLAARADALGDLARQRSTLADAHDFATAYEGMSAEGVVSWLTGFAPAESVPAVLKAAAAHGWGILARDPEFCEAVPTLLRPPRLFQPILRLFDFLGISPAYTEADISSTFFIFFTIFFAMLIGDAGYGALMLAGTLWARRKARRKATPVPNDIFSLLTVFSVATIAWGFLSGTYFGITPEALPAALNHSVARWLTGQNNIMLVCFGLGAAHMSFGHAWNAIALFPDSRFLAQAGWCGVVWTMFCASCAVVGIFAFPQFMYPVAIVSVVLIAGFMLKRSELKTNGVDLGMLPLNIISTLGDVISYVRLFAVATASVKLAETFNGMAVGLDLPLVAKIPAMLLILVIGHGLNLIMGALSILVHAVRLNTLEFSNHKGITWSGFAYKPLRRRLPAS